MPISDLLDRTTSAEITEWQAFFKIRKAHEDLEHKRAKLAAENKGR